MRELTKGGGREEGHHGLDEDITVVVRRSAVTYAHKKYRTDISQDTLGMYKN